MYDVIVVGLGANGSSALYHLAKAGKKVLGIDRFAPPHTHGSSHGQSRIIRQAYHESPFYVPLVQAAYEIWYDMERISGKKLLLKTGGITMGAPDADVVTGAIASALEHNLPYQLLDHKDIQKRYPALKPTVDTVGVFEPAAGILFPEDCISVFVEQAARNGAAIHTNEMVLEIIRQRDFIKVVTNKQTYFTQKLVLSTGAWMNSLLPDLQLPLSIERQVLYWFKNKNSAAQANVKPDNLPVYIWQSAPDELFYGFPDLGDGIKVALHHFGRPVVPDELKDDVTGEEINRMQGIVEKYFNISPEFNYSAVCMYTNTPDEHFIIDHHPDDERIIIASPCSGHGFKFSSLTGKIISDMTTDKPVEFDIQLFNMARFAR
ncbi:N-methyl-L-tryptophan oxidase [Mucilaginibacter conchicola]|uniref:N-methyl-L-tryptophan oxidase n=1 Tax=Mucilaginibacter conchicola TaxID=2303333 RepID=A0A372NVV6_9SPHI|nr:N-methyl-L-tryptophan oxidase [Mucilaginibacter conchicola]RFZ94001.1 N-methyl-L-tryptophan oxidase [Mucilaginibacter conchicola]